MKVGRIALACLFACNNTPPMTAPDATIVDSGAPIIDSGLPEVAIDSPVSDAADDVADASTPNPCPPKPCNGPDLMTDPDHCGACGHSCWGGQCLGGKCQPFKITTTENNATSIGVDPHGAWWANQGTNNDYSDGEIRYVSDCSNTPVTKVSKVKSPLTVVSDGTNFWFKTEGTFVFPKFQGDGQLLRCPVAGCGMTPTVIESNIDNGLWEMRQNATHVFWPAADGGYVHWAPKNGGSTSSVQLINLWSFDVDATNFYFSQSGFVSQQPIGGMSPTLLSNSSVARSVVVNADAVYWFAYDGNEKAIYRCAFPNCMGGPAKVVTLAEYGNNGPGIDGSTLYWFDHDGTAMETLIRSCPTSSASCVPKTLLGKLPYKTGGFSIAVSGTAIYWTIGKDVWRLAK